MKRVIIAALTGAAFSIAGAATAQQAVDFSTVDVKVNELGNASTCSSQCSQNVSVSFPAARTRKISGRQTFRNER